VPKADGFIDPHRLYTRRAALGAVGVGMNTMRAARRAGIELRTLPVGKQLLCLGRDVISYLQLVSEHQQQEAAHTSEGTEAAS